MRARCTPRLRDPANPEHCEKPQLLMLDLQVFEEGRMAHCALVGAADFNADHFKFQMDGGFFDFIIAVDGGFAHLESIGVVPDMAVGDFDSLGYVPKCRRVSRHPVKKDKTDMELAMEKALYWKQDDLYVYGGLSGRLDHTLANLQLFAKFSERGAYVTGIGEDFAVRALTGPDVYDLPALNEGIVSVIALNDRVEGVIETGLLYSMDDEPLTSRVSRGISNEFIGQPATIGVERGTVLVFHPLP